MLRVLLPDGYDAPENRDRRYPVLYLNDGQNLFDTSTSVLNPMEWRVDETVHALVAGRTIPPMIVVGIDSAGRRDRFKEYFPYVDQYLQAPEPNPQGTLYPAFLVDEVIPFIEDHYRVVRDPAGRGIGGSSAGALAAICAVVTRPGVFGRLLVESPSIYVDEAHILRDASKVATWPERLSLGVGTNERGQRTCDPNDRGEPELVRDVRRFERLLHDAHVDATRIQLTIVPCAMHDETHSFAFAIGVGLLAYAIAGAMRLPRARAALLAAIVVASHGILDTMTDGGRGVALLWPFSNERFFAPWRPIPVAPLGLAFWSLGGLRVAVYELMLFCIPFVYALWPKTRPSSR